MHLQVMTEDIEGAGKQPDDNPIARAIRRTTSVPWCLINHRLILQLDSYYCRINLPRGAILQWQVYRSLGSMRPFKCEVDLTPALLECRRGGERRSRERRSTTQPCPERRQRERRRIERRWQDWRGAGRPGIILR